MTWTRRLAAAVALALFSTSGGSSAQVRNIPPLQAGDVIVTGGRLFDGVRDTLVPNTGLVIRQGIFLEVGATLTGRDVSKAQVITLADTETILPGLFDLHAHYAMDLLGQGRVDEFTVNPIVFLANGVTSTFPAGEVDPENMEAARWRIARGEQVGARIHGSGPYFGTARPGWQNTAMTPERIRQEVDAWAARGVRGFKAKGIQPAQLFALIDQAHRHGLPVTGHLESGARNSVNPRDAIYMGIDRIEHFMGGDAISADRGAYGSLEALDVTRPEVDAVIQLYLRRNVYYNATVSAYGYWATKDPRIFTQWEDERSFLTPRAREITAAAITARRVNQQFERIYRVKFAEVKRFFDAGGGRLITLGTDHPSWGEFLSGFGAHRELHAFVLAGIPPAAALKMATINGARALRLGDVLGSIEAGKLADLVVVRGNPLEDITITRRTRLVVLGGRVHDTAALFASARDRLGPATPADDDWWKGNVRLR
jgi:imidazolonepropionase-like amidohydrolase